MIGSVEAKKSREGLLKLTHEELIHEELVVVTIGQEEGCVGNASQHPVLTPHQLVSTKNDLNSRRKL